MRIGARRSVAFPSSRVSGSSNRRQFRRNSNLCSAMPARYREHPITVSHISRVDRWLSYWHPVNINMPRSALSSAGTRRACVPVFLAYFAALTSIFLLVPTSISCSMSSKKKNNKKQLYGVAADFASPVGPLVNLYIMFLAGVLADLDTCGRVYQVNPLLMVKVLLVNSTSEESVSTAIWFHIIHSFLNVSLLNCSIQYF
ncbi:hypothetical protein SK128_006935 [Halocaridina rubra]|uniref:Uncharacterized protein n=1 Tax=Halocaridina rubra TaxID=373956 RepID=A0AAN9AHD0_HALRR